MIVGFKFVVLYVFCLCGIIVFFLLYYILVMFCYCCSLFDCGEFFFVLRYFCFSIFYFVVVVERVFSVKIGFSNDY